MRAAVVSTPDRWTCGACGGETSVRHFLRRGGVTVHDVEAAYREAIGLDDPEPSPPGANKVSS